MIEKLLTKKKRLKKDTLIYKWFDSGFNRLSYVNRYSGFYVYRPENVSEHIGIVSLLAVLIAQELQSDGYEINWESLMKRVTYHDIDEAITGDIPRPTKYFNSSTREELEKVADYAVREISAKNSPQIYDWWKRSKSDESIESFILKISDFLSVVLKSIEEYYLFNNLQFKIVLSEIYSHVEEFKNKNNLPEPIVRILNEVLDLIRDDVDESLVRMKY